MGGGFNMVSWPTEKTGSSRAKGSVRVFCEFIDAMNLVDLPLHGGSFTWSNGQQMS